jgi:hypothetical protein
MRATERGPTLGLAAYRFESPTFLFFAAFDSLTD